MIRYVGVVLHCSNIVLSCSIVFLGYTIYVRFVGMTWVSILVDHPSGGTLPSWDLELKKWPARDGAPLYGFNGVSRNGRKIQQLYAVLCIIMMVLFFPCNARRPLKITWDSWDIIELYSKDIRGDFTGSRGHEIAVTCCRYLDEYIAIGSLISLGLCNVVPEICIRLRQEDRAT